LPHHWYLRRANPQQSSRSRGRPPTPARLRPALAVAEQ
jgi:hypothetical protein